MGGVQPHQAERRFGEGHVEVAPLAREAAAHEACEHRLARSDAPDEVGEGDQGLHRASFGVEQLVEAAAQGHVVQIVPGKLYVGAGLPVPRQRAVHDGGVDALHGLVVEAQAGHHSRAKALHEHIRPFDDFEDAASVRIVLQVGEHALLAAVHRAEDRAFPPLVRVEEPAGLPLAGFDLHHLGAPVRQAQRCIGARKVPGEVDDLQTFEQLHSLSLSPGPKPLASV